MAEEAERADDAGPQWYGDECADEEAADRVAVFLDFGGGIVERHGGTFLSGRLLAVRGLSGRL
jgi:hypothetical protein